MKKKVVYILIFFALIGIYYGWQLYSKKKREEFYKNYPKGMIRVILKNVTDTNELAFKMTKLMRYHGFDVVDFGNANSSRYEKSVIIRRKKENKSKINILKNFFNIKKTVLLYDDDAEKEDVDATIILGKDILGKEFFKNKEYLGGLILNGDD